MPIKTVDATTLKRWLDDNEAVLIDVREPAEHNAEKINAATLIPLSTMCEKTLPETFGKKLVIHCHSGKRSHNACEKLLAKNPDREFYTLEGGICAWSDAGYAVQKSKGFFIPLNQQVQITLGLFICVGTFLSYAISPMFLLFTGFLGVGLIFAGLSGFCGLALLLAKMPWNQK